MNEIQLTDHLVAHISAGSDYGRYQAKICEDGNFRDFLYAMSLKRLKRKCEKYAKRERKAIAYVATLKENHERKQSQTRGNTQMASEQSGHARIHGETARRAIG